MVKNYYYLIVGLLCILFAVTHTWNGLETTLPILNNSDIGNEAKTTFTYIWHIIGVENLIFGIVLIIMAFQRNREIVKFSAWIIIAVLLLRWITITAVSAIDNQIDLVTMLPDTVAILIVVILLALGTQVKRKVTKE